MVIKKCFYVKYDPGHTLNSEKQHCSLCRLQNVFTVLCLIKFHGSKLREVYCIFCDHKNLSANGQTKAE